MAEKLKYLTAETFDLTAKKGLVLVDFYADWCGPCRMLTPILEEVSVALAGAAEVVKIDVETAQEIAARFQVSSIPTLILFNKGAEVGRLVGLKRKEEILEFVRKASIS